VGVTEETDAIAIVVSEETGAISLVAGGQIVRHLDAAALRQQLSQLLGPPVKAFGRRKAGVVAPVRDAAK
jgi:hypothetical protein